MRIRLYDGGLVRRMRKAARARLARERRKSARGKWWKGGSGGGGRYFWLVWLLINLARLGTGPEAQANWKTRFLSGISLAMAGVALSSTRKLAERLTVGAERRVLWFYPMAEKGFFEWATWWFMVRSAWVICAAAVVYVPALRVTSANGWMMGTAAAVAEWLVVLCAAMALVQQADKVPAWAPLGLYVAAGVVVLAPAAVGETTQPLALVLPTGWLNLVMMSKGAEAWGIWAMLAAVAALGTLCWWQRGKLEGVFGREAAVEEEESEQIAEPMAAQQLSNDAVERFAAKQNEAEERIDEEMLEDAVGEATLPMQAAWRKQQLQNWSSQVGEYVRQGDWLKKWNWNGMWPVERVVGWCLNEREKSEAQFLLGPMVPRWSGRWRTAAIAAAVGMAAAMAGTSPLNMVAALAFAVSIGAGVPVLGGTWPATNQGRISGKFSPIFGCYPLSYRTAGWTMFKVNLVRTVAWAPLGLMMGLWGARSANESLGAGCWVAGRAILAFVAVLPILSAGKFSKVTNDTLNLRWSKIPVIVVFVVGVSAVLGLDAGVFIANGWWPGLFLAMVTLVSWGSWALYGWYYERAQVDLLREQQ